MSQYNPQAVITPEMLERFRMSFESDPVNKLAQNAVTRVSVHTVALNHEAAAGADHTFSCCFPATMRPRRRRVGAAGCSRA